MGFFSKVKKAVKKAAKAVKKAVNKATDAVADVFETIGNGIGDALTALGNKIPGLGAVFRWLGDVISSAFDVISSVIKGIGAIVGGVLSGIIRIIGGIVTLDLDGILAGFGDIFGGIFGGLLMVLAKVFALVQVIFTIGRPRALNRTERSLIRLVFHDSIATYNVRVVDGFAGIYSLNDRPFVAGNIIYMKDLDATNDPAIFVHECIHVWQNQHVGSSYAMEALWSQWFGVGYDWEKEAADGLEWIEFEREAQGEMIEHVFDLGGTTASPSAGNGAFFAEPSESLRSFSKGGVNHTGLANRATREIRGETPWRISELWA